MTYLDGELPVERARECAVHLEQCSECQTLAADLKSVDQQLTLWQVEVAPEGVAAAVMPALDSWQGPPKAAQGRELTVLGWLRSRPWVWGLVGAVGAVLAMSVFTTRQAPSHLDTFARIYKPPAPAVGDEAPYLPERAESAIAPNGALTPPVPMSQQGRGALEARKPSSQSMTADTNGPFQASGDHVQNSFSTDGQLTSEQQSPMVARTASLALVTKDFDQARTELEAVLRRHNGYAAQLTVNAPAGAGRSLTADLRIPASQLDAALAEIKKLGRVEQENQGGEEVTQQYVDLNARLSNAHNTKQRLVEVLQQRTGKMADVLAVENEIARVRGEIEEMEAERKSLEHRVAYGALQVELKEEYKASLNLNVAPPSGAARMRNSLVDGLGAATDSLVGFVQLLLYCGPFLLLWMLLLFWPARTLWRRWRANLVVK